MTPTDQGQQAPTLLGWAGEKHTPVAEFGHKESMSGWLRVLVTVERIRSRWAVVQTAYTTRDQQWGAARIPAGSLHTRVVVASGLPTKSAAIAKAQGGTQ